jgi:hypothetical protein
MLIAIVLIVVLFVLQLLCLLVQLSVLTHRNYSIDTDNCISHRHLAAAFGNGKELAMEWVLGLQFHVIHRSAAKQALTFREFDYKDSSL